MNNVFTETDSEKIDALLYTAIFNEVDRLKNCNNKKERQEIRSFILTSYQALRTAQMDKKQTDKVIDALVNFVIKVAEGKATSEAEIAVLPEVAKILFSMR